MQNSHGTHAISPLARAGFDLYLPLTRYRARHRIILRKTLDMAAIDTTRTAQGTSGLIGRIGAFLYTTSAKLMAWNDARVTRKSLSALSDRELADIGLCRGDIDQIDAHSPLV